MTHSFFGLRRVAPVALSLVVALVLVACGGGNDGASAGAGGASAPAGSAAAGGSGTATVENGAIDITADNMAFNVVTIEAPANEAFTITLTNDDTAPHNISFYTEEGGGGDTIVQGEIFDPGTSGETEVPALDPGTYYFHCDLHPNMKGTLVVTG